MKISDIFGFFRRLLSLRKPEKTGEGLPLEKQELPEEKESAEEKKPPRPGKGKAQQRKIRKPRRKRNTKKGRTG
jgi:hypothetical protein